MVNSADIYLYTGKFIIGTLLFIRISGLFAAGPFFKNSSIIPQVKIMLAVIIAGALTSSFWEEQPVIEFHLWYLVLLVFKEFFIGMAIGFVSNMVFYGARLAGGLIDFDLGYHVSMMFNQEDSPTLVGEIKHLVTLMIFLMLNGHHYLLEALFASVRAVPIDSFEVTGSTLKILLKYATMIFITGIKLSAPILVAIFVTNFALALLARVAPQTNIFIMSFQLKIVVGLLVLLASVSLFVWVAKISLQNWEPEIMKLILSLNPLRV